MLVIVLAPFIFGPCADVPYGSQPLATPLCHYSLFWQSSWSSIVCVVFVLWLPAYCLIIYMERSM